jgi:hypothetical protein
MIKTIQNSLFRNSIVLLSSLLAFFVGGFWVEYRLFPISNSVELLRKLQASQGYLPQHDFNNFPDDISGSEYLNIKSESDSVLIKQRLKDFVFSNKSNSRQSVSIGSNCREFDLNFCKSTFNFLVEMSQGFESNVVFYETISEPRGLVIVHGGHGVNPEDLGGRNLIEKVLIQGFDVAAVSMPLNGKNKKSLEIKTKTTGIISIRDHNAFNMLEEKDFSSISYFVEPVSKSLTHNHLL